MTQSVGEGGISASPEEQTSAGGIPRVPARALRVFVSATSPDLGNCRAAAKDELLTADMLPVTQENFGPDFRSLVDFLRAEIARCDAVICLLGGVFGAEPDPGGLPRRSYSQLEYDLAIEYQKPVLVFVTSDDFRPDGAGPDSPEERELQRHHRERVMQAGHKWEWFSDASELRVKVARAVRSLGALLPAPSVFYRHIPRMPGYFVGRSLELRQLREALARPAPAVIAVVGMGGQGKTTLVHRALIDLASFPYAGGFWCTAYRGGYTFDLFLDDVLAYFLGSTFDKRLAPDVDGRVSRLLSLMQQRPLLLVMDGIERWLRGWNAGRSDPQHAESADERAGFYPGLDDLLEQASALTGGSHLILTTRSLPSALDGAAYAHIPVRVEDGAPISLEGLDPGAAADLLTQLGAMGTATRLAEVAALYAYHPLALTILGTLLRKRYGGRLDQLRQTAAMDPAYELHHLFDEVRENLPGRERAERFLAVAAQCIETPCLSAIAAGLIAEGAEGADVSERLVDDAVMLADWNLVGWEGATQAVTLHPLVKQYFASLLPPGDAGDVHSRLSWWYSAKPMATDATSLADVAHHLLAIRHAVRAGEVDHAADLMFAPGAVGHSLFAWLGTWGHQLAAVDLLEEMAAGAKGPLRGTLLLAQAQMHQQLAQPHLAADSIAEAMAIFSQQGEEASPVVRANLAKCYAARARLHREIGDSALALSDLDEAVALLEGMTEHQPGWQADLASLLAGRADAAWGVGAASQALRDYDRALDLLREDALEQPGVSRAGLLVNRAVAAVSIGDAAGAIADLSHAIDLCMRYEGVGREQAPQRLLAAHAQSLLADALEECGRLEEAQEVASRSVQALQAAVDGGRLDHEHYLARALVARASVMRALVQWPAALLDLDKAVLIYERLLGAAGLSFELSLAHALCIRAAVRSALGDQPGSDDDRAQGFATTRRLMERWPAESEIKVTFLRDALCTLGYLASGGAAGRTEEMAGLVRDIDGLLAAGGSMETVKVELRRLLPAMARLVPLMGAVGPSMRSLYARARAIACASGESERPPAEAWGA